MVCWPLKVSEKIPLIYEIVHDKSYWSKNSNDRLKRGKERSENGCFNDVGILVPNIHVIIAIMLIEFPLSKHLNSFFRFFVVPPLDLEEDIEWVD